MIALITAGPAAPVASAVTETTSIAPESKAQETVTAMRRRGITDVEQVQIDGWAVGEIGNDLHALYEAFAEGRPSPLPEPALRYADYAVWQRDRLQGDADEAEDDRVVQPVPARAGEEDREPHHQAQGEQRGGAEHAGIGVPRTDELTELARDLAAPLQLVTKGLLEQRVRRRADQRTVGRHGIDQAAGRPTRLARRATFLWVGAAMSMTRKASVQRRNKR